MCGIAGILAGGQGGIDAELLTAIGRCLAHRGPDGEGFFGWNGRGASVISRSATDLREPSVAMVHRRLSVIDPSEAGAQPMSSPDGRYTIVYNGMIYNYRALRRELEEAGHRFRSECDTEVLLAAYSQWREGCLTRLVGMFAFGIWDAAERTLVLARDFFGIKPLYYTFWRGGLAFASEIKALLQLPALPRRANAARVYKYLRFGLSDSGEETFFEGIYALPSSHYVKVSLDAPARLSPVRYWRLDLSRTTDLSFDEAARRLGELFSQSVTMHLRSDVPLGVALSGGLDSSAITMLARAGLGPQSDLSTFSYVADNALSEERYVDVITAGAAAQSHKIALSPRDLLSDLGALLAAQDEPFGSPSIYAQFRVFRRAHEAGMKVMLDGQGADEMLAGYVPYLSCRLASLLRQMRLGPALHFWRGASRLGGQSGLGMLLHAGGLLAPTALQKIGRRLGGKGLLPRWIDARWFARHGVAGEPIWRVKGPDVLRQTLNQSIFDNSLPQLLRYEDHNSMAYSIESRVPFLTPALVEFVFSLPEEYLVSRDYPGKRVFRAAMRGTVPNVILDRKDKIGFATPGLEWLQGLGGWYQQVLTSPRARAVPALRHEAMMDMFSRMSRGQSDYDHCMWRCVNLIAWAEQFDVEFPE
ncbi:MAG: asparagine synthase (glutamine-hydrolyzing) [Planctomycetaceae bacterium]|nr:asparagine synthase (glutamine-hydrolyzing) [Planctomycetaceae bacterium]